MSHVRAIATIANGLGLRSFRDSSPRAISRTITASRQLSYLAQIDTNVCIRCRVQQARSGPTKPHISSLRPARSFSSSIQASAAKVRKRPADLFDHKPKPSNVSPPSAIPKPPPTVRPKVQNVQEVKPVENSVLIPEKDVKKVFGANTTLEKAQYIVTILQQRRISGALAEKGVYFDRKQTGLEITESEALTALEWLRQEHPMDEQAAAAVWAEQEADKVNEQFMQRAMKLGLYKKEEEPETPTQPVNRVDEQSILMQRQKAIKAEKEQREKEEEEKLANMTEAERKEAMKASSQKKLVMPWKNAELYQSDEQKQKRKRLERMEREAYIPEEEVFAERSAISRLWAPTALSVVLAGLAYILSEAYVPPRQESRMWSSLPPSVATCLGLAVANLFVLVAWRRPEAWKYLNRYFMLVPGYPRALSMVGNLFSHQTFTSHFIPNMAVLLMVGPTVHEEIGRGNFLALYLISGLAGSLTNLYWHVFIRNFTNISSGASGCLYGMLSAFFVLKDWHTFKFPFTDWHFTYNSETAVISFVLLNAFFAFVSRGKTNVDHASHFGGLAAGVVYGLILKSRAKKNEVERRRLRDAEVRSKEEGTFRLE